MPTTPDFSWIYSGLTPEEIIAKATPDQRQAYINWLTRPRGAAMPFQPPGGVPGVPMMPNYSMPQMPQTQPVPQSATSPTQPMGSAPSASPVPGATPQAQARSPMSMFGVGGGQASPFQFPIFPYYGQPQQQTAPQQPTQGAGNKRTANPYWSS